MSTTVEDANRKVIVFHGDGVLVRWAHVTHISRTDTGCRVHLDSYGFQDVSEPFDVVVEQLVEAFK